MSNKPCKPSSHLEVPKTPRRHIQERQSFNGANGPGGAAVRGRCSVGGYRRAVGRGSRWNHQCRDWWAWPNSLCRLQVKSTCAAKVELRMITSLERGDPRCSRFHFPRKVTLSGGSPRDFCHVSSSRGTHAERNSRGTDALLTIVARRGAPRPPRRVDTLRRCTVKRAAPPEERTRFKSTSAMARRAFQTRARRKGLQSPPTRG
jgi:hypothetical protein